MESTGSSPPDLATVSRALSEHLQTKDGPGTPSQEWDCKCEALLNSVDLAIEHALDGHGLEWEPGDSTDVRSWGPQIHLLGSDIALSWEVRGKRIEPTHDFIWIGGDPIYDLHKDAVDFIEQAIDYHLGDFHFEKMEWSGKRSS